MARKDQVNAADEEQVLTARERERQRANREADDFKKLIEMPEFRRFVWRYVSFCGVFDSCFTGNSQTFFNEGQRNVGLKLLTEINDYAPDAYPLMLKEHKEDPLA